MADETLIRKFWLQNPEGKTTLKN